MLQGLYAMSMNCMEAAEAQFHTAISVSQLFIGLDGNLNQDMKTHVNIALTVSVKAGLDGQLAELLNTAECISGLQRPD